MRRTRIEDRPCVHHAMSRIVGGEMLLRNREKEVLRKMLWKVADFCGVEVLTYCIMSNHFHVLVLVPEKDRVVSDAELLRRFKVLYPKPTKFQTVEFARLEKALQEGNEDALAVRERLLSRMHDLSEFMKTLKQRFSIWYNRNHDNRKGTLWMDRFKSVLVEGEGNPLLTMAAYIDLNPVRAGLSEDPKDYRFCGYAEAVAGDARSRSGLKFIWAAYAGGSPRESLSDETALRQHRTFIFAKGAEENGGGAIDRKRALNLIEREGGILPKAAALRCRVRYFTDGLILGSAGFVQEFCEDWKREKDRKRMPKVNRMTGADWGDLAVARGLRLRLFS